MNELYTNSRLQTTVKEPPSRVATSLIAVLVRYGAEPRYCGRAPMLEQERVVEGWTFRPLLEDDSHLPPVAHRAMAVLSKEKFMSVQYVIGHEPKPDLPKVIQQRTQTKLLGGMQTVGGKLSQARTQAVPTLQKVYEFGVNAAPAVLKTTQVIAQAAGVVMGAVAVGVGAMAIMAMTVDPVLFAVIDPLDGGLPEWTLIAEWDD